MKVVLDRVVDSSRSYSTGHLGDTRFSWLQGEPETSSLAGGGPTAGGTLSAAGERSFTTDTKRTKKIAPPASGGAIQQCLI